ncbi:MAG: ATP-binding cassette domain-containing protein [Bacteroidota bacterium]|nr:ATP-binding cassette domain-containing protein [Candidatus Kapabacteria bacterium]MCX7936669.1 ATP-binding cassette domain-containing protein [Chlorobiota bacterium]MDW8272184.1 ATP-binding cassette domain-containing protein [Bacteroidota bacterium]
MQFELQNVTVQFEGIPALHSVSATISSGSMVLVTGPTGSGKTTLLRLLYADILPTNGAVFINGQRTSTLSSRQLRRLRRQMGIAFQDVRLLEELTVYDNVLLPLLYRKVPLEDARRRTLDVLVRLGISYVREKFPSQCSMGERHLVGIARAIAVQPQCIIADEPTGNLDVDTTALVAEELRKEHERGATVIVATHDPFFAAHFAATERLALYEGNLVGTETAVPNP